MSSDWKVTKAKGVEVHLKTEPALKQAFVRTMIGGNEEGLEKNAVAFLRAFCSRVPYVVHLGALAAHELIDRGFEEGSLGEGPEVSPDYATFVLYSERDPANTLSSPHAARSFLLPDLGRLDDDALFACIGSESLAVYFWREPLEFSVDSFSTLGSEFARQYDEDRNIDVEDAWTRRLLDSGAGVCLCVDGGMAFLFAYREAWVEELLFGVLEGLDLE